MLVGLSTAGAGVLSFYKGAELRLAGQEFEGRVVDKFVERPSRRQGVRAESVSVNGVRVRSTKTYFNDYFLTVGYVAEGGDITSKAPVSYNRWHDTQVGSSVTVTAIPGKPAYADAMKRGMMYYGLRHIFFGLVIIVVGLLALRLPD